MIGLEIGARTLRLAWATRKRGGALAWHYHSRTRSPEASPASLRDEVAGLLRPVQRLRARASLLLAAPISYVRQLTVETPASSTLAEAIREQLPTILPVEVEQAQFSFTVQRRLRAAQEPDQLVTVAACERAIIEDQLALLWEFGWVPRAVVPASLGLLASARLSKLIGHEPTVIMDLGERRTTMVIVDGGEVVYARDVALGSDHLTEALMARVSVGQTALSLSWEQAEALKREVGIVRGQEGTPVGALRIPVTTYVAMIQPVLEQLVSELRRTMTFGAQASAAPTAQRVLLSGNWLSLPRSDEWVATQLGVPVARLDCGPLVGVEGSSAAIVCGLASLERIPALDLQPAAWTRRRMLMQGAHVTWKVLAVIAIILWLGTGLWRTRHQRIADELTTLEARWEQLQPAVTVEEAIQARQVLIQQLVKQSGVTPKWFEHLARTFPKPVRLTQLSVSEQRQARFLGQAQGWDQTPEGQVSELALWIERERICTKVQLESTRRDKPSGDLVEFTLTCQLP